MFAALSSIIGPAIKHLAPVLAGWGVNKLFNSSMAKNVIPSVLLPSVKKATMGIAQRALGVSPQNVEEIEEYQQYSPRNNQRKTRPIRKTRRFR